MSGAESLETVSISDYRRESYPDLSQKRFDYILDFLGNACDDKTVYENSELEDIEPFDDKIKSEIMNDWTTEDGKIVAIADITERTIEFEYRESFGRHEEIRKESESQRDMFPREVYAIVKREGDLVVAGDSELVEIADRIARSWKPGLRYTWEGRRWQDTDSYLGEVAAMINSISKANQARKESYEKDFG